MRRASHNTQHTAHGTQHTAHSIHNARTHNTQHATRGDTMRNNTHHDTPSNPDHHPSISSDNCTNNVGTYVGPSAVEVKAKRDQVSQQRRVQEERHARREKMRRQDEAELQQKLKLLENRRALKHREGDEHSSMPRFRRQQYHDASWPPPSRTKGEPGQRSNWVTRRQALPDTEAVREPNYFSCTGRTLRNYSTLNDNLVNDTRPGTTRLTSENARLSAIALGETGPKFPRGLGPYKHS